MYWGCIEYQDDLNEYRCYYTKEFTTEFEKANRLMYRLTWIEITPELLKELASQCIKLAEMIENAEE